MNTPTPPKTGYLRLSELLKIIPVSKSTWWAGVKTGRYPRSVKLSSRVTAWRWEDIQALMESFHPKQAEESG